jgi:hypothetical protein
MTHIIHILDNVWMPQSHFVMHLSCQNKWSTVASPTCLTEWQDMVGGAVEVVPHVYVATVQHHLYCLIVNQDVRALPQPPVYNVMASILTHTSIYGDAVLTVVSNLTG